jgi:hypothetical protein
MEARAVSTTRMTAAQLLAACEAGRTHHMETQPIRGEYDPRFGDNIIRDQDGRVVTEDVLVHDAEALVKGHWWPIEKVCTDLGDESKPVFLDVIVEEGKPTKRTVLKPDAEVEVRGLTASK